MIKNQYNITTYRQAVIHLLNNVLMSLILTDPLLGKIGYKKASHSGPIRNVRGNQPLDQQMDLVSGSAEIPFQAVIDTNIQDFSGFLWKISEEMKKNLSRGFFKTLNEVTNATGNVVNAKGEPLSYDHYLDMLEVVEVSFDENNNVNLPTLVTSPSVLEKMKQIKPTEEQKIREAEIIDKKREEFYAQKRIRKLYR